VLETSSYHVILACVAAGTGFAAVPLSVLDSVAVKGELRIHPLPGPASKVDTSLAWRSDYRSAKMDALKEILL
jgi:DNA-binding transcriptional LysR family regulator